MWARKSKGGADIVESLRWTEGYERVAELAARLPGTLWSTWPTGKAACAH